MLQMLIFGTQMGVSTKTQNIIKTQVPGSVIKVNVVKKKKILKES